MTTPCVVEGSEKQQSLVVLPAGLTTITLSEGPDGTACPGGAYVICMGDPVTAQIVGDSTGDVVGWTVTYNVKNIKVRLDKLRILHSNDAGSSIPSAGLAQGQRLLVGQLDQLRHRAAVGRLQDADGHVPDRGERQDPPPRLAATVPRPATNRPRTDPSTDREARPSGRRPGPSPEPKTTLAEA